MFLAHRRYPDGLSDLGFLNVAELAVIIPGRKRDSLTVSLDLVAAKKKMPLHRAPKLDGGNEASGIPVLVVLAHRLIYPSRQ